MTTGIVYIIINEAMPGLIKIGRTENNLSERIKALSASTSVPLPFECYYAREVQNSEDVEGKLHVAFSDHRINPKREFFQLDPNKAKAALSIASGRDVTPKEDVFDSPEEQIAVQKAQQKNSAFRFSLVDVPQGSVLTFTHDDHVECVVKGDKTVLFEGEELSLSAAAMKALNKLGYKWSSVRGPAYWTYEGETLSDRRDRYEAKDLASDYSNK